MDGQGLRGGRQTDDRAYWQGDGDGADRGEIGSGGGGGYDGRGHSAGFGGGGIAQPEPAGADAIENSSSHKFCSHARIYIFLSFFDARFAKTTNGESAASQLEGRGLQNRQQLKTYGTVDVNVKRRGEGDPCPLHYRRVLNIEHKYQNQTY